MLLQFELDGQSCEAGAYTFRLDHAINFKQLKLRAVSIQCGNDKLAQTWSYTTTNVAYDGSEANRQLTSPLYLDLTGFVGESSVAHYLPTVHPGLVTPEFWMFHHRSGKELQFSRNEYSEG